MSRDPGFFFLFIPGRDFYFRALKKSFDKVQE